jgi:hypothetical protein
VVRGAEHEAALAEQRRRIQAARDLRTLLGLSPMVAPETVPRGTLPAYCGMLDRLRRQMGTAQSDSSAQAASLDDEPPPRRPGPPGVPARPATPRPQRALGDLPQAQALTAVPAPPQAVPAVKPRPVQLDSWAEVSAARDEIRSSSARADQYLVEVHKKWAISVACLVFAVVGIPMALRFPRGGMGLVIGGGLAVFSIYYVGLIAGEGLGNRDIVDPWVAMWAPNIIFAVLGIIGIWRVSRESGTTRGGNLAELWDAVSHRFRRRTA